VTTRKTKPAPSPLQKHFDFTDKDLAENQQGRITEHQKPRLLWSAKQNLVLAGVIGGFTFLIGVGAVIKTLTSPNPGRDLGAACVVLLLMLWATFTIVNNTRERWKNIQADLAARDGHVSTLTGPVAISRQKYGRGAGSIRYMASIKHEAYDMYEAFEIPKRAIFAFKKGALYNVYVTKASRMILSAATIGPDPAFVDDKTLYKALRIGDDDLLANREGRLSKSQRKRLGLTSLLLLLSFMLVLCGLAIFAVSDTVGGLWWVTGLVALLVAVGIIWAWLRPRLDAWRGTVLMVEGQPELQPERGPRGSLLIKDHKFQAPLWVLFWVNPNAVYRIYYTPTTRTIVGMEQVNPGTSRQNQSA
jgi:hypothetical protein